MKIITIADKTDMLECLAAAIRQAAPGAEWTACRTPEEVIAHTSNHRCDVAFLDMDAAGYSAVALAEQLKEDTPRINLIFVTQSEAYYKEAIHLRASGCIAAPVTAELIREELENLRYPVPEEKRLRIQTFGNFEVYVDGEPLAFKYNKAREMLAYLVDRKGALCSLAEITSVLFEDDDGHENYVKSIRKNLLDTLNAHRLGHVISHPHGMLGLMMEHVDCDYYAWSEGKLDDRAFTGQYMAQYSWAEVTSAFIQAKVYQKLPKRGGEKKQKIVY